MSSDAPVEKAIRLDKWLKLSRVCKTRSIATRACEDGKVKVNGARAKPSHVVKIGDHITIKARKQYRMLEIVDIVQKSISNKDARELYREQIQEIPEESQPLFDLLRQWDKEGKRKYKGRPTKKERRDLDKLKGE